MKGYKIFGIGLTPNNSPVVPPGGNIISHGGLLGGVNTRRS